MEDKNYVEILKALGDETRFSIFGMLRNGTLCACKILEQLNITQPTLSHHMKVLCDCGLVTAEKDWKWTYYSIDCSKLKELLVYLGDTKCNNKSMC
jgi:ArsR family transcriptional regulator